MPRNSAKTDALRAGSPSTAKAKPKPDVRRPAALHGGLQMCTTTKLPLTRAPVPMARRLLQIATAIWAEACADESLNHIEFGLLGALQHGLVLDQISLAAWVGVDRTNIGLIIDGLEKRGFVERNVNPNDRRARLITVTPEGKATFTRQARQTAVAREKILGPLTGEEREMFYNLLEKIIAANEQYSIPGAGRRKRGG